MPDHSVGVDSDAEVQDITMFKYDKRMGSARDPHFISHRLNNVT